jgi:hypothetical protein
MPRKATEDGAKLAPLNIRTTQERREKLEAAAMASGRSLTQQVERYLEMAMNIEERLGGEDLFEAISLIGDAAAHVLRASRGDLTDYRTRARVIGAISSSAEWAIPTAPLYASGDLKEIAIAVEELRAVLPYIVPNFDQTPLMRMLDGWPIPQDVYDSYLDAIEFAEPRYHGDANSLSVLRTTRATLISAQERMQLIATTVNENVHAGRLDAFTLFAQGHQSAKE